MAPRKRITPAHAGKRCSCSSRPWRPWDHPRTRGEKDYVYKQTGVKPGSPPHTRGKVRHLSHIPQLVGITPAHAGKSPWTAPKRQRNGDHPRTRGEKHFLGVSQCHNQGSPPHTRGKGPCLLPHGLSVGITPARAGKSLGIATLSRCPRDHPRTRGEKVPVANPFSRQRGSPPHTRGKEPVPLRHDRLSGITPAHAGKSTVSREATLVVRDHPRTRGEKVSAAIMRAISRGSPPHTRGKAGDPRGFAAEKGITPAHAGKRLNGSRF